MTSAVRSLWLGPHLLNDADGARAHREAAELGSATHDSILAIGDRLAASSAMMAQCYYRNAASSRRALGADGFAAWVALGERIAGCDPVSRAGANAFFSVPVDNLAGDALASLDTWCETAIAIAETSSKLAGLFLTNTAPWLTAKAPVSTATLAAWAKAGVSLHSQHGWQGEFLAQAFFGSTDDVLPALSPAAFQLLAGAASALFPRVREREFFAAFPRAIEQWPPEDQANLLRITIALAPLDHAASFDVYRCLPGSLATLHRKARSPLLSLLAGCGAKLGAAVRDFVPIAGSILRQIKADQLEHGLAQVQRLAKHCPQAVVCALRSLPRVCEEADRARIEQWFGSGIAIAAKAPSAALAYFSLESRTSLGVLHQGSTAAALDQHQGMLRKYLQMMSGEPSAIRSMDRFTLRPEIEEFPAERGVALPFRIDLLPTHEDNLRLYRILAVQLAGRRAMGTYDPCEALPADASDPPGRALFRYLTDDERPPLLEDIFTLAEGVRVFCAMAGVYRGLAGEAAWAAGALLEKWADASVVSRSRRLDALFVLALVDGQTTSWPAWLDRGACQSLLDLLRPLRSRDATLADSLAAAEAIARSLEEAANRLGQEFGEADGSFYDTSAGEMIYYDLYDDDEATPPSGDAPVTGDADPPPPSPDAESIELELSDEQTEESGGAPISPEELQRLLQQGVDMDIRQGSGNGDSEGLGLYITDLTGKIPDDQLDELRQAIGDPDNDRQRRPRRWLESRLDGNCYSYDEWDYQISDYRSRWCRLYEIGLEGDSGEFFQTALGDHAQLLPEVRRHFQRIRPEMYRTVRGLEDGEDFDLNAAIAARIDARAGIAPSSRLYVARKREERDVATLFLVDMSASTDEPLADGEPHQSNDTGARKGDRSPRRIIDVTKETLAIMAQALEEIGDAFAIYGFSGHGRDQVEIYRVKSFGESLTPSVKARLGAMEPRRSTRMGTALRHSIERMASVSARSKHLILLSDGFPQDFDYGQDRRSNIYGIRDTAVALREAEAAGITPFCITVDKSGHDYLREMCDDDRYMVIDEITALPRELPKIYQRVVRS